MSFFPKDFSEKKSLILGTLAFLLIVLISIVYYFRSSYDIRKKAAEESITDSTIISHISALDSNDLTEVEAAAKNLLANPQSTAPYLVNLLGKKDASIVAKGQAIFLLGKIGDKQAVPRLLETLKEDNAYIRINTINTLGEIKDPKTISSLVDLLSDNNEEVRRAVATVLGEFNNSDFADKLINQLKVEKASGIKSAIVASLGKLKEKKATRILIDELDSQQSSKKYKDTIIRSLGEIKDPSALPSLEKYLLKIKSTKDSLDPSINPLFKGQFEMTEKLLIETIEKIKSNKATE